MSRRFQRAKKPSQPSPFTDLSDAEVWTRDGRLRLFVYGTLRPGGGLHSLLDGCASPHSTPATLPGYALYGVNPGLPAYPVMVEQRGASTVGDILYCSPGEALMSVWRMEIGAGYGIKYVRPVPRDGSEPAWAAAFYWPLRPDGARIRNDDWSTVRPLAAFRNFPGSSS